MNRFFIVLIALLLPSVYLGLLQIDPNDTGIDAETARFLNDLSVNFNDIRSIKYSYAISEFLPAHFTDMEESRDYVFDQMSRSLEGKADAKTAAQVLSAMNDVILGNANRLIRDVTQENSMRFSYVIDNDNVLYTASSDNSLIQKYGYYDTFEASVFYPNPLTKTTRCDLDLMTRSFYKRYNTPLFRFEGVIRDRFEFELFSRQMDETHVLICGVGKPDTSVANSRIEIYAAKADSLWLPKYCCYDNTLKLNKDKEIILREEMEYLDYRLINGRFYIPYCIRHHFWKTRERSNVPQLEREYRYDLQNVEINGEISPQDMDIFIPEKTIVKNDSPLAIKNGVIEKDSWLSEIAGNPLQGKEVQ